MTKLNELMRQLGAKTRQIEALVAEDQEGIGEWDATDYDRLRTFCEKLIEEWQDTEQDDPGGHADTSLNRLIAERQEIEEQILDIRDARAA